METTVAALKKVLSPHFAGVEHVAQCCRRAGLIPAGGPGYGGARSARLEPLQAVQIVLASASGAEPKDAPAAAQRLAAYRLTGIFPDTAGPSSRVEIASDVTFGDWAADELRRAATDPAYHVRGWEIQAGRWVLTFSDDARAESARRLRLVRSEPDLYFAPDEPPEDCALPPPAVRRVALVEPELIRAVAGLFAVGATAARLADRPAVSLAQLFGG